MFVIPSRRVTREWSWVLLSGESMRDSGRRFDTIGYWSEVKLDIVREYAKAYSTVIAAQTGVEFYHLYVDGFAGAGVHISRTTGEGVLGSPLNALAVEPKFREYHFIDLDSSKVALLPRARGGQASTSIYGRVTATGSCWTRSCRDAGTLSATGRCGCSTPTGLTSIGMFWRRRGRRSPSRFS